jgi:hypothetical protein
VEIAGCSARHRLDLAANALGAAWFQMNELEKTLDDPAAISD